MGSLVQFKPRATAPKGFTHLFTYDRLAQHELVLVRGDLNGVPHLSLMLTNLPNEAGYEVLVTSIEAEHTRAALDIIADAVCLAAVHLTPNGEAWA